MILTRDEGPIPPYGYIDMVSWETSSEHTITEDIFIISGSNGHRTCGTQYRKLLHKIDHSNIKTFSQIYGSMPCGQIFDLALASVAARYGLIPNSYCSIKLDAKGNLGVIHHS